MSRASTSWVLLLASALAGGCSLLPAPADKAPHATRWFAHEQPLAQLPADDATSRTFAFAGHNRIRTATFATGPSADLLRVDGQKVPYAAGVQDITFSPDGLHYAYAGQLGKRRIAVVDGQVRPEYDARPEMTMSDDSHHLGYIVSLTSVDCAVIDGKLQPLSGTALGPVSFSDTGKHYAVAVRSKSGECMVIDGIRGPAYDQIFAYQHQGEDLYYAACRGTNQYIVTPGGPGKPRQTVSDLYVSPNGQQRAWLVSEGPLLKKAIVVDATNGQFLRQSPCSPDTNLLGIGDDGRAICVTGGKGNHKVVVGDKRIAAEGLPTAAVSDPRGQHVAAIVVRERDPNAPQNALQTTRTQHVELDGQSHPEYVLISSLTFSPRGTHLAYWALRPDTRWALVVDAQETLVFDSVPLQKNSPWIFPVLDPAPVAFSADNTLTAIGISGRQVTRVTLTAQ